MADQPQDIFNQNTSTQTQTTPASNGGTAPTNDQLTTLLAGIRNERGEQKYKTVEEALKALGHSQEFIPQLKNEKQELEQQLAQLKPIAEKVTQLEDVISKLTTQSGTQSQNTPSSAGLSEEQIATIVERELGRKEQEKFAKQNIDTVKNAVLAKYGDKAQEVFYKRASELGMSNEEFNILAARTPKAVLKLVGIDDVAPTRATGFTSSVVNTQSLPQTSESLIGANKKSVLIGATSNDLLQEKQNAKQMIAELEKNGLTVADLSDPKVYSKYFK